MDSYFTYKMFNDLPRAGGSDEQEVEWTEAISCITHAQNKVEQEKNTREAEQRAQRKGKPRKRL